MKSIKLTDHHNQALHQASFTDGEVKYFSLPGTDKTTNEDSLLMMHNEETLSLILVADGMGGHPGGDEASQMVVDTFSNAYRRASKIATNEKLFETLDASNQNVISNPKDCGSTLCLGILRPDGVQFVCVGDSVGMVLDQDAKPKYATLEENSVSLAEELGVSVQKSFLMNFVGFELITYQVSPCIPLDKGDQVILMTDGASEYFDETLAKSIKTYFDEMCAKRKTTQADDATFVVFTKST